MTFCWTQMLKQTLYVFLFKWITSGKIQIKKLFNVWKPHFKSPPLNHYMSQNKTFTIKPSNTWKTFLHKFEISFETCNNGKHFSLTHLKLEDFNNLKAFLPHTSNFNIKTFNNSKNSFPHTFSNFNVETFNKSKNSLPHTWNLKIRKKFFHTWKFTTFFNESLPHLPLTWKRYKLLVCHHLEMDSHLLCKLKPFLKKILLFSMQHKLKTLHYFLF